MKGSEVESGMVKVSIASKTHMGLCTKTPMTLDAQPGRKLFRRRRIRTKEFVLNIYTSESAFTIIELLTTVYINLNS